MILELFPDVQRLSIEEKRCLAEELLSEVYGAGECDASPAIVDLLHHRLAEHDANPTAGSSWADAKTRVFGPSK